MSLIDSVTPSHYASFYHNQMHSFVTSADSQAHQNAETLQQDPQASASVADIHDHSAESTHGGHNHVNAQGWANPSTNVANYSMNSGITPITAPVSAFDVLGHRHKRRKVSVEPEGEAIAKDHNIALQNGEVEEVAASTRKEAVGSNASTAPVSGEQPAAAPATPKRRRGRPPKSSLATLQSNAATNGKAQADHQFDRDEAREPSTTPKKKRTPRKKTMQIGANGKLFDTPKDEQPEIGESVTVSPKKSPRGRRTTQRGKNMILKNGKFVPKLVVVLRYSALSVDPAAITRKVEDILSKPVQQRSDTGHAVNLTSSVTQAKQNSTNTHPFFTGKAKRKPRTGLADATTDDCKVQTTDEEGSVTETRKPVAWKDIVFKTNRPQHTRDIHLEKPIWPPLLYHHTGRDRPPTSMYQPKAQKSKQKAKVTENHVSEDDDVLLSFARRLSASTKDLDGLRVPERLSIKAKEAIEGHYPDVSFARPKPISSARSRALSRRSAFDRAEAPGPLPWTQQHCPADWEDVLQYECHKLYGWLQGLAVHNVKSGLDPTQLRPAQRRRKKPKKRDGELDDFIVSDEDIGGELKKMKNAILIVGPTGCGKTASVYAVAKQLGFEVFEIHSGMRRSQKDIFDKVGDMAQNHMVQGGSVLSRDSSVVPDPDPQSSQEEAGQQSVATFFGGPMKKKTLQPSRQATPQPRKEQKQSLVLFEEVDQVFEDDRGFWSGVQALIENSKRPVVLTCNDLHKVPLDELDLHAILTYVAPTPDIVAEYLFYVASMEGHLIQPGAIKTLYRSKGCDLRATMMELDFWCQMTVGSRKGGLDWFPDFRCMSGPSVESCERIFSKDTYCEAQDLSPTKFGEAEDMYRFLDICAEVSVHDYLEVMPAIEATDDLSHLADIMSAADLLDPSMRPVMYSTATPTRERLDYMTNRSELPEAKICQQVKHNNASQRHLMFNCLEPLKHERPVFPPSQGRLAPSLDSPCSVLATDIAPYVRIIAAFNQHLEQFRDDLFSSQGKKTRSTRAARAAAEGGDKANTRRERWFPAHLDLQAVMRTGGNLGFWLRQREAQVEQEREQEREQEWALHVEAQEPQIAHKLQQQECDPQQEPEPEQELQRAGEGENESEDAEMEDPASAKSTMLEPGI